MTDASLSWTTRAAARRVFVPWMNARARHSCSPTPCSRPRRWPASPPYTCRRPASAGAVLRPNPACCPRSAARAVRARLSPSCWRIGAKSSMGSRANSPPAWRRCSRWPAPARNATCRACAASPPPASRRRIPTVRTCRTMASESPHLTEEQALRDDTAARAAALDTRRAFLLQAPAGAGKTTVLGCRLLALLAPVDGPEEILALTFTRKAAAEMRTRVLHALQAARAGEGGRELEAPLAAAALRQDRERAWRLLETPARLRVMTIDAYCQTLAAQLPIASRSGLRLEIAEPAGALYAAAARRVLERALADADLVAPVQLLFGRLDNDWSRFEDLLVLMLQQRAHWLPRVLANEGPELGARVAASLRVLIAEQLSRALDALPAQPLRQGEQLAAQAARNLLTAPTGHAHVL